MGNQIFVVQDRTGTVAQLSLAEAPIHPIAINDTGVYVGIQPWNGQAVSLAFTVGQVFDSTDFGITTALPFGAGPGAVLQSGWPPTGDIEWLTGSNAKLSPTLFEVSAMNPANAYITTAFLAQYSGSRGVYSYPESPVDAVMQAIVQATDYIDQRYRYKGVKVLQFLSNSQLDPLMEVIDPWLAPFSFSTSSVGGFYVPSTTDQQTQWPRQGVVDFNGDTVYDVPLAVKQATAELALRVLSGTVLQPDYDPNIVTQGGVVQSFTKQVGPLRKQVTYDTKLGLGFFPDFPIVTRMLAKAGLLVAGGGMSLIR